MQTNRQEQQQEPTQPTYSPALSQDAIAAPALNPPGSATGQNAPIDTYLNAICLQIPAEVPAETLKAMRREMRGHLEAAVVAHCELGQDEDQAVQSALIQFGPPSVVAHQWQQEWITSQAETNTASVWPSLKIAMRIWVAAYAALLAVGTVFPMMSLRGHFASQYDFDLFYFYPTSFIFMTLPLVVGAMIGLRAHRRPVVCTLAGNVMLWPLLVLGMVCVRCWVDHYTAFLDTRMLITSPYRAGSFDVEGTGPFLIGWLLLSLLSSSVIAIGRHIERHIKKRARQIVR